MIHLKKICTRDSYIALLAALLSLGVWAIAYKIWRHDFFEPWPWTSYDLQDGDIFSQYEHLLPLFFFKTVGKMTGSEIFSYNVYITLTYLLVPLVTYIMLRKFAIQSEIAVMGSLIYTFIPYHNDWEKSITLLGYYTIPLAGILMLDVFGRGDEKEAYRIVTLKGCLLAMLIGINGIYYSMFSGMMLLTAGILSRYSEKNRRGLKVAVLYSVIIVGLGTVLAIMPFDAQYIREFRPVIHAEGLSLKDVFEGGLRIFSLFIPAVNHRMAVLGGYAESVLNATGSNQLDHAPLGIIPAIAFFTMLWITLSDVKENDRNINIIRMGKISIVCILVTVTGGLGMFAGYFITDGFFHYSRIVVFLELASITTLCILLNDAAEKKAWSFWRAAVLSAVIAAVALLDQIPAVASIL